MRLKRIKLAGFKSFVDPTAIPFPDDMTAIVGPNGCGKSNVIDAVRWVLGESSAKNLRGDAMTDVIFNGSSARKPVSQCSVELVFDNSSGRIQGEYASYNELSVKRVVTRDAQSNYYLNSSKCRRRDVTDLFLGTGLGPRSYAIIEQGMISRLIESKPQELRVFIEEAAGISKYKERRRETENRIRHTRENLERLEDVLTELDQQLQKLQRQAAAAKRYKALKADERKYKTELAALRWLKYNKLMDELDQRMARQDTDIEQFIAQQRGDERGIIEHQQRQDDLKQRLDTLQNQMFKLGNEITRIEQTQLHSRQRKQQIEQELSRLAGELEQHQSALGEQQEQLEQCQWQLEEVGPEAELLNEQTEDVAERLASLEQQMAEKNAGWRAQEQAFYQQQQQLSGKQQQIQSQQTLISRARQRAEELQQQLGELDGGELEQQLTRLQAQHREAEQQHQKGQEEVNQALEHAEQAKAKLQQAHQQWQDCREQRQQSKARLTSLKTLQESAAEQGDAINDWLESQDEPVKQAWQMISAEPGWEKALETALSQWLATPVITQGQSPDIAGSRWLFAEGFTRNKPGGTLAAKVLSEQVPGWLTQIHCAESGEQAKQLLSELPAGQSVITAQGLWQGPDWQVQGVAEQNAGMLDRASEIRQLQGELANLEARETQLDEQVQHAQHSLEQAEEALAEKRHDHRQQELQAASLKQQTEHVQQQYQSLQDTHTRLEQQYQRQLDEIEQDQEQVSQLAEQVEELSLQLEEQQSTQQSVENEREQLQSQLIQLREQHNSLRSQAHDKAMQRQQLQNQYQNAEQGIHRHKEQLTQVQERQQALREELMELEMPIGEQGEELQLLLEQQGELEQQKGQLNESLAEVEQWLTDAQKDQQGVQDKIAQMKEQRQSLQLEYEGHRVRANSVLEQLQEMDQALKPVLENLDPEAEEDVWQQALDKTTAAVSRLGAVNLAAVEEYESQAERKAHLDTQQQDLNEALETLESAIRKIDRETRARFKETFEQVNEDLKMLFPKVFGGGAAYLDLTDDDLLETGVTIMARPPGKKNSTIHLLSGGEKALTALSLVFAIFRLNPAPFCLLDEVDAPLDDANVGRFCKLVSEMSKSVQFIYITHNKIAMEMATHLTGVTMAEPGVSRMVSVDVDEAVALAEL
ncbi:Chromosome partition protein Smc [Saliniradius amylolyticus]|uniref:Chromosome partition protein Smc n=1 Tax=Saliniradius amylolyticus TaxID=2183582 RepID=A0A2S2E5G7_9ALTE|nr:chromosome segregation protein SMC [Saliniradius amylolyticus]AWL12217.1 Chromosome partition protein Smc [Saliniradius amylolyticus]